ncbi:MAG: hypothetical protein Q9188_003504 [Gyalolechia gomerana]
MALSNGDSLRTFAANISWFRADYVARNQRYYHTCLVIGNRQPLSLGGLNALDASADKMSQDTATHGLQIFDMPNMRWANPTTTSSEANPSHTSDFHTGSIAGGFVGGLTAICFLSALLFWFLRRRRWKSQIKPEPYLYRSKPEMADTSNAQEAPSKSMRFEADDGQRAWEVDGMQRTELDASAQTGS